jgi:general stress protein YciG
MANENNNGKKMTTEEAGRLGGEKVAEERGPEFYSEIGKKGGHSQGKENNPGNFANDREKASEAGRKGGQNQGKENNSGNFANRTESDE